MCFCRKKGEKNNSDFKDCLFLFFISDELYYYMRLDLMKWLGLQKKNFVFCRFRLQLQKLTPLEVGERFVLRDGVHTIATGVVTKLLPNLTDEEKLVMAMSQDKKEKHAAGLLKTAVGKNKGK